MIDDDFFLRKAFLDHTLFVESNTEFELEETIHEGRAKLICTLGKYAIAFSKVDDNKFPYIKHKKCADAIIFTKVDDDNWGLKIIEFKKTMSNSSWEKSKEQFKGAILNSLAIGGFLGIRNFVTIEVYSAFREEKLTVANTNNPVLLKQYVGKTPQDKLEDWKNGYVRIDFMKERLPHNRIQLDVDGNGRVHLG